MELRLYSQLVLAVALLQSGAAGADGGPFGAAAIKQFPLDEHTVYEIGIGRSVPTTLMFPAGISAIEGANISTSPETPAAVLLAYTAGQDFFSVRALSAGAAAAVNVIWRNRTIVIRFQEGIEPCGSARFYEEVEPRLGGRISPVLGTEKLQELMDRAKVSRLLETRYPGDPQHLERAWPGNVSNYPGLQVTVDEVFRFDAEDTLIFFLRLENRGETTIHYRPQRLAARLGDTVYPASLVEASGTVTLRSSAAAAFAITGSPSGDRANLAPNNLFDVMVRRAEPGPRRSP